MAHMFHKTIARNNKLSLDDTAWAQLLQMMHWFDPVKKKLVDIAVGGGFDICGERESKAPLEVEHGNTGDYQRLADFPDAELHSPI